MVDKKMQTEIYKRLLSVMEYAAAPGRSEEYRRTIDLIEGDMAGRGLLDDDYYALKLNLLMQTVRRSP